LTWRRLIGPVPVGVLGAAWLAAALAQPIDEPSDREHGQQRRDDYAHADEHISENDGGAAVDAHGGPPELKPLLADGERQLIRGGYRSTLRRQSGKFGHLDDRGAGALGQVSELPGFPSVKLRRGRPRPGPAVRIARASIRPDWTEISRIVAKDSATGKMTVAKAFHSSWGMTHISREGRQRNLRAFGSKLTF